MSVWVECHMGWLNGNHATKADHHVIYDVGLDINNWTTLRLETYQNCCLGNEIFNEVIKITIAVTPWSGDMHICEGCVTFFAYINLRQFTRSSRHMFGMLYENI